MKILLIKPKWYINGDPMSKFRDLNRVPPLNLGIIAALSGGHTVEIIDEDFDTIPFEEDYDLVGITVVTFTAQRAYEIAGEFRKKNIPVVLGGVHPSLAPQESLKYCDSVVVGEAEGVWQELLIDLKKNQLKKIYRAEPVDMKTVPAARRDLYHKKKYRFDAIQFTRGCLNRCAYCYLPQVPWGSFRTRPIEDVCQELSELENKYILIVDDNLFLDKSYAKKIFKKMIPLKKRWFIQAPVEVADDEELLDLMVRSGCFSVSIGFESVDQSWLDSVNKHKNKVNEYQRIVKTLQRKGILVESFFLFGFDNEKKDIFKRTLDVIKEIDVDDVFPYLYVPLPGSRVFEELKNQRRLLHQDWRKYAWHRCNFVPKQMTPEELQAGFNWFCEELNRHFRRTLLRRIWRYRRYAVHSPYLGALILKNVLCHEITITREEDLSKENIAVDSKKEYEEIDTYVG